MSNVIDFAERARKARPDGLSGIEASFEIRPFVPEPHALSYATLSRLERGLIDEEKVDVVFLAGLAKTYGVPLEEISPKAAESAVKIKRLLDDVVPDLRSRRSRCIETFAGQAA